MRHKHFHLVPVAAALAALFTTQANALDFSGYLRSGAGSSSAKGTQNCFALPGAYSKYRLGNECETYVEFNLDQNVYNGKDGVKFDYHVTFATVRPYSSQQDYESLGGLNVTKNAAGAVTDVARVGDFALRQSYIEAKNLPFLNGASVWAGKRFYDRNDVHMTDFYYWDTSGYGVGVQGVPAGPGKFSYALLRNTIDLSTPTVANQSVGITRHDFRYSGVPIGFGDLTFGLQYNSADTKVAGQGTNGTAVTLQHFVGNLWGGYNKVALQYGNGTARNLVLQYPANGTPTSDKTWRLVEQLQVQLSPEISGMATFVYQDQKNNYKWISYGIRPVYHFSDYFKLQAEYGHDEVKPVGQATRKLDKFTIAPTIVAGRGFWTRPELRVYATHATWNAAARDGWGGVAGGTAGPFGNAKSGSSYGFQAEVWF